MAAYYTAQAYDASAPVIWAILTDFSSWPRWFPNVSSIEIESGGGANAGTRLLALGADTDVWTRWEIAEYKPPTLLVCEHVDSNAPMSGQVQAAYLQFELIDEPE